MEARYAEEVAADLASDDPAALLRGVRALADSCRKGDWYEVPNPGVARIPTFVTAADVDAAADLVYVLFAHGFFVPPVRDDERWQWCGALLGRVGGSRVGFDVALAVVTATAPTEAVAAVFDAIDRHAVGPHAPAGVLAFAQFLLESSAEVRAAAVECLSRRSSLEAWGPALHRVRGLLAPPGR